MDYANKRKKIRNMLIEKCLNDLRKTNLPDYTLGFLVKSIHFHTPWYFLILFIFLPKPLALLSVIPLFIAFLTFMYPTRMFFNNCRTKIIKRR